MPVIKSAKKALRRSKRSKTENDQIRQKVRNAVKGLRTNPTTDALTSVYSALDTAAKKHVLHKNKVARLKSSFSKLVAPAKKTTKKASK